MNISIEIGGPLAEAINNLAAALISAKQADTVIEKASTKARAKKPEPGPAQEQPTSTATTETETPTGTVEAVAQTTEPDAGGPTREDAKKAVLKVAKEKGHDAASALLKQFGATKISEVKDEDLGAIIKASESA